MEKLGILVAILTAYGFGIGMFGLDIGLLTSTVFVLATMITGKILERIFLWKQ